MKIGFISDAHGNPYSLKLCLERLNFMGVDEIVFLGDAAGYFPQTNEVIELLQAFSCTCLLGNHDAMLIGKIPVDAKKDGVYKAWDGDINSCVSCHAIVKSNDSLFTKFQHTL